MRPGDTTTVLPREGPTTGPPAPAGFQQRLGLFDSTMLVAGTMIGSGIFIVSAGIALEVGSTGWVMTVWVLAGVMTVIGALSYAELAAMMPHAGGQYVYLREAYSPIWGFLYGWTMALVIQTGTIAAVGVAFAKFLGVLVPALGPGNVLWTLPYRLPGRESSLTILGKQALEVSAGQVVAVGLIVLLTWVNCRGIREGKWVQNVFTVSKIVGLLLLIVVILVVAHDPEVLKKNLADLWNGATTTKKYQEISTELGLASAPHSTYALLSGLAVLMVAGGAMVGALFSADAWNNVTFTAGEIRNPRRNLPLSLALGTGIVIVLYLLANVAYLTVLPLRADAALAERLDRLKEQLDRLKTAPTNAETTQKKVRIEAELDVLYHAPVQRLGIDHARDERVGTAAMERVAPRFGVPAMAIAIMLSTFGCLNGLILMGARLYYAMARDGLFFRSVGQLNRRGVPAAGLVFQSIWSGLLVFSGTYGQLLDYVIFAALLFYVLTVAGLFVLRRKRPDADRPYRAFGYPVIPAIYIGLCAAIMVDLLIVKPLFTWPGLLVVVTGFPVYFLWRWSNPRVTSIAGDAEKQVMA